MPDPDLPCAPPGASARTVHAVRPGGLEALLAALPAAQAGFLRGAGFAAKAQELALLPGEEGVAGAVLGLGEDRSPLAFGDLAFRLPPGDWRLAPADIAADDAALGFLLGAYRYRAFKPARREPARVVVEGGRAASLAAAVWMVRDLINTPANLLGPAELADIALELAARHGATPHRVAGEALARDYPTVAAVGAGSARVPVVAGFSWRGSGASEASPLIALCGKGVCFDTGGYDLKPGEAMLRMKKDMAGAATALGIARAVMEADLPLRLMVRIGCVENSVSGHAMRPSDVLRTRGGPSVEVGNTDAEGRLVLCDLLAEACDAAPELVLDFGTLTGGSATGPDVAALFSNDEAWSAALLAAGQAVHDPMWRMPLWDSYDSWLDSPVADMNNVSAKRVAGTIVAALFLRRFVAPGVKWAHLDIYAWNDSTRPGKPEGGEAQALRAVFAALAGRLDVTKGDWNTPVT